MILLIVIITLFVLAVYYFINQPKFGKAPSGDRMERIRQSPHFKNNRFQNLSNTPALSEGVSYYAVMKEFFFEKKERKYPKEKLPSVKTDLKNLNPTEDILVWFGHSSYFMQIDGTKILVDPVLSGSASPVKFTTRSFNGTDIYTTDDLPEIDYLFITHDHWDHLDHDTLIRLRLKVKKVITGLGVGAHLEAWNYEAEKIVEADWNDELKLEKSFTVHAAPARHFSGRGLTRNGSLWMSYVVITPKFRFYLGGDSGYDHHFKKIGAQFGPFDLVILENGQYDKSWKYIHMMPEQVVQAAEDLQSKKLFPVHWSKFSLSNHAWDEPMIRLMKEANKKNMPVLDPIIGSKVNLRDTITKTSLWWEHVK
ncbi:MAG TPA: MBL fold metallo-hydrolase [Flavitalea sp.]|nr:MBL fold metallo-hydrolase [Flavitalea sp.]